MDTTETKDNNQNVLTNFVEKTKNLFQKKPIEFTAEYAWIETSYGYGSYRTSEERVRNKQEHIVRLIKSKFPPKNDGQRNVNANVSYRCVVDIEEDLLAFVDEIFKPFIDGGFKVINLSKQVSEIEDENVYLISWKRVFKNK